MKPYLLPPRDRVRDWRKFRLTFDKSETDQQQIEKTLRYWKEYPIMPRYLDIDFPETWPTCWELLSEGQLCEAGICLMMHQTLILSDDRWTPDRVEMIFVDDRENSVQFMAVVVDQKYTMHYSTDEIEDLENMEGAMVQNRYRLIDALNYHIVKHEKLKNT
jgi:hypothetical protein